MSNLIGFQNNNKSKHLRYTELYKESADLTSECLKILVEELLNKGVELEEIPFVINNVLNDIVVNKMLFDYNGSKNNINNNGG